MTSAEPCAGSCSCCTRGSGGSSCHRSWASAPGCRRPGRPRDWKEAGAWQQLHELLLAELVPLIALMGLPLVGFAAEPGVGVSSCLLLLCGFGFAYGLGLQRPFLDALPQDGQGQACGLLGSGNMTLQGVGLARAVPARWPQGSNRQRHRPQAARRRYCRLDSHPAPAHLPGPRPERLNRIRERHRTACA